MKKLTIFALVLFGAHLLSGCKSHHDGITPAIVPETTKKHEAVKPQKVEQLKIIGSIEPIYILPIKAPFYARVDTGAETSSIDVKNLKQFERDGEKWVSFDVIHRESKESAHFEKKIKKRVAVRRINEFEHRKIVTMQVRFAGETFSSVFSLADRDDFDYQALVGRNILMGKAVVDVSVSNTLR